MILVATFTKPIKITKKIANQKGFGKVLDTRTAHRKNVSSTRIPKNAKMLIDREGFKAYKTSNAWVTVQYAVKDNAGNQRTIITNVRPSKIRQLENIVNKKAGLMKFIDTTSGDIWAKEFHAMGDSIKSIWGARQLIRAEALLKAAVAHNDIELAADLADALQKRDINRCKQLVDDFENSKSNEELTAYYKYEDLLEDILSSMDIL